MTLQFKTNINTIECVQRISPYLEDEMGITYWHVDTEVPSKTLTIETETLSPSEIISIAIKAGFIAKLSTKIALN